VVVLRFVDAAVSLIAVAIVLWVVTGEPAVVPFAIAFGSVVGAILQRRVALSAPDPVAPAMLP
jgi:hypothetical protein